MSDSSARDGKHTSGECDHHKVKRLVESQLIVVVHIAVAKAKGVGVTPASARQAFSTGHNSEPVSQLVSLSVGWSVGQTVAHSLS